MGGGNLGKPEGFCAQPRATRGRGGGEGPRPSVRRGVGGEEDSDVPRLPAAGTRIQCLRFAQVQRVLPVGGAERDRHPSLFAPSLPASQRLSYPVSGLIFYAGKWKGITMKIYVCSERGCFPSVASRNHCFPFPFFILALGSSVESGAGGACLRGGGLITGLRVSGRAGRL